MIRPFILGAALTTISVFAAAGHAQQRGPSSREDLLDALTRHIQICAEMSDSQARLSCYDRLQTQVGGVQAGPPSPTPLRPGAPPLVTQQGGPATSMQATPGGPPTTGQPLAPPPLNVPGGGTATLGGGQVQSGGLPPAPPMT